MPDAMLDGLGVLVTRPREQAAELAAAIEVRGGKAVLFPVIDIVPRQRATVMAELGRGSRADITIFISQNAVKHGLTYAQGRIAAIGPTTTAALEAAGREVDIRPSTGFDTEHLLAEPAFDDVDGQGVRIVRGVGGREALARELRARGARVEYVEAYERRLPDYTANAITDLEFRWHRGEVGAVVVMSVESLTNLAALFPRSIAELLGVTPLVTPAERVLKESLDRYPGCPARLAAGPRSSDIIDALAEVADASPR